MNRKFSIKQQTTFVFLSKYVSILTNLIINSVLARILTPEEFGVVAIISVFTAFFNIIADIGIGSAVVQNRELESHDINMLFTITLYFAIVLTALFAVISFPIAKFYENRAYITIGAVLSLSLFFNTLNTIPNAVLMREEKFFSIAVRTIVCNLISGVSAVCFALKGAGYYALVIQSVSNSAMIFGWNYCNSRLKLTRKIELSCIKKVKDFSVYWFGFNLLNYFARNLDNLMMGKILGERALGYYDKAYKLMLYPVQNLTYILNSVLHPILSKYQDNLEEIYLKYVKILKVLSLVGLFISVFCLFNGREIILVVFGQQWEMAVPAFKILSISMWFQITNSSSGAIYASINKTKLLLKSGIIYIPIQIILFIIASRKREIEIIAVAASVGLILKFFIDYIILIKKGFGYSALKFFKIFKFEPLLFFICYISMSFGKIVNIESDIMSLVYNLVLSGIVYGIGLLLTGEFRYFKDLFWG